MSDNSHQQSSYSAVTQMTTLQT